MGEVMPEDKVKKEIAIPLPTPSGEAPRILRVRGDEEGPKEVSVGALMPAEDGKPIPPGADYIHLQPCESGSHFHVKTIYESPTMPGQRASSGAWRPMQVSRETYETNWDRAFGKKVVDETVN